MGKICPAWRRRSHRWILRARSFQWRMEERHGGNIKRHVIEEDEELGERDIPAMKLGLNNLLYMTQVT